jgi:hypothetical protein
MSMSMSVRGVKNGASVGRLAVSLCGLRLCLLARAFAFACFLLACCCKPSSSSLFLLALFFCCARKDFNRHVVPITLKLRSAREPRPSSKRYARQIACVQAVRIQNMTRAPLCSPCSKAHFATRTARLQTTNPNRQNERIKQRSTRLPTLLLAKAEE